ncbi:MAG: efflux RND transporter periplasmic adaptor subunit [Gemmatimonadota bacterium]|nr:MAG: efflux RND transporter periplasmic adaptor subunit [Gemmatimonadota bacterium]
MASSTVSHCLIRWRTLYPVLVLWACGGSESDEPPPAHIDNPVSEADLTTIRLTPDAVRRIGIVVGTVENRELSQRRTLGGELMAPPGSGIMVTAPRAATILAPEDGRTPSAGSWVTRGQALVRLVILPEGNDLARAQEGVTVAAARVENARAKARRAEQLLRDSVGTAAELEDAQAELASAEAVLRAARARLDLLQTGRTDLDVEDLSPITLQAPESGVVHGVHFAVGQTVSDGAPLMEIVKPNPLWVRVPVYVGDMTSVDRDAPATLVGPSDGPDATGREVIPIQGPPTADASTVSADLFYRLDNSDGLFRPGQRVGVSLRYKGATDDMVVPWSAVLHDIYGGTWVYEVLDGNVYVRRRVEVRDVVENLAVLRRGPEPGTRIVVTGAAELFSTEFGISH